MLFLNSQIDQNIKIYIELFNHFDNVQDNYTNVNELKNHQCHLILKLHPFIKAHSLELIRGIRNTFLISFILCFVCMSVCLCNNCGLLSIDKATR